MFYNSAYGALPVSFNSAVIVLTFEYKLISHVSTLDTWALSNTLVHIQSLLPYYAFNLTGCKAMLVSKLA